jgi:fumarate hydratase class II
MVCAQIFGNDLAITSSAMQGHLQLNVFKPVIAANFLQSAELLSDSCNSFRQNCIYGIIPNFKKIDQNLNNSLMLITCLNNKLGYEKCAEIAKCAYKNGTTLKKEAVRLNYLSEKEFDILVDPKKMCNL